MFDNAGKLLALELNVLFDSFLSDKMKCNRLSADFSMLVAESGESERAIQFFIYFVSYTNASSVHDRYGCCQHFFLGRRLFIQMRFHFLTNLREFLSKLSHAVKFRFASCCYSLGMIAVLFASGRIYTSSLQMSVWTWTDPDILPCRRKYKFVEAFNFLFLSDLFSFGIKV